MKTENNHLEARVMDALDSSIREACLKKLTEYQSPFDLLFKRVFERKSDELNAIMEDALSAAITTATFRQDLRDAFDKKLAKLLVGAFEGEIERRANKLREDPAFRAKIVVAIDAAVKSATP